MAVTGPDFIALQVRDLETSARFYTERLGLTRAPVAPPGAVVFATASLFCFDCPLRADFNFHLLAYPEQEPARILHPPLHVGDGKPRSCRNHAGGNLHLER